MISGISSAYAGLSVAAQRFDGAASAVSAAGGADADADTAVAASGGMSDAMVQMAVARFAMLASIHAALATTDMMNDALRLGGYGTSAQG